MRVLSIKHFVRRNLRILTLLSCTYTEACLAATFSFLVPSKTATVVANTSATAAYTITNTSGTTLSNISFIPPANLSAYINTELSSCINGSNNNSINSAGGSLPTVYYFYPAGTRNFFIRSGNGMRVKWRKLLYIPSQSTDNRNGVDQQQGLRADE